MWRHRVDSTPDAEAWWVRRADRWEAVRWRDADQRVRRVAHALLAAGVGAEDRVAIVSETRLEWILADMGIACAGGATVAIFPNTPAEACAYILADAGAVVAFVDSRVQAERLERLRSSLPRLKQVIVFDDTAVSDDGWIRPLSALEAAGEVAAGADPGAVDRATNGVEPDQLATLIYTSGTTGTPKGVAHPHDAWLYEAEAIDALGFVTPADRQYLFLPLSHVFARVLAITAIRLGIPTALETDVRRVADGLREVSPTFFAGVPSVFERMATRIREVAEEGGALRAGGLRWAMRTGRTLREAELRGASPGAVLRAQARLADRLVYGPIRDLFGGRLRFAISGGAPLSPDVGDVLADCRIPILEGYGLTETAAASCVNRLEDWRIGSVGPPMPGCEVQIADDGEVWIRSRGVMRGYWGRPEATAEVKTADGWLKTGDIGELRQGHLWITDRKKEILVTAGGKKVAPAVVEQLLVRSPLVSHAALVGDGRPFCVALLTLDVPAVSRFARTQGRSWASATELADDPVVRAAVQSTVDAANRALAPWEAVRAFALLAEPPTPEGGTLTASGKLRRRALVERHAAVVEALYAGVRRPGYPKAT